MDMEKISILDCTLRDGGYYTNWSFDQVMVEKYLAAVAHAHIDVVEIGFRFPVQEHFVGGFGYSTDEFLETLPVPNGLKLGVMVNAKDVLAHTDGAGQAISEMFRDSCRSPVDLVRVALHFSELPKCKDIVLALKDLGYTVGVNVMQVGNRCPDEISAAARDIRSWGGCDVLYFADSFGNMTAGQVREAVEAISQEWNGPIGFHSHDNMARALENSLAALDAGATWLDGTILGMGRGAGNVRTEYLLLDLVQRGTSAYYPEALFPMVMEDFERLRQLYGWGPNLLYHLSATYGVHPTYVQQMLGDQRYGSEQVISALAFLRDAGATSFSPQSLRRAVAGREGGENGSWDARDWVKGREVLIVGPGPGAREHMPAICRFVEKHHPVVLCLNVNRLVPKEIVDAYVACHESRVLMEAGQYCNLEKPLILPFSTFSDVIQAKIQNIEVWDYGMNVAIDTFSAGPTGCVLPRSLAVGYAMAAVTIGGAERILLAGFDGYPAGDVRQEEMLHLLEQYGRVDGALPLLAVTPTTYSVKQGSIYAPKL